MPLYQQYLYHGDGSFKGIRYKERIDANTVLDWVSTVVLNDSDEDKIFAITVQSGNMVDETTSFHFKYRENGEIDEVTFLQGYFQVSYKMTYKYEKIGV